MITIKLNKTYEIPSKWHELDKVRFIALCKAIDRFESGKTDFDKFRLESVAALLKINLRNMKITDTLCENFFRIAEQLTFPYEITSDQGRKIVNFDIILDHQMLPTACSRRGYVFKFQDGILETTITAEQYIDAIELMQLYSNTRKIGTLGKLFAILYAGQPYSAKTVKAVRPDFVPFHFKIAAYYNFRGILEWIRRIPKYDLIFNHSKEKSAGSSPIGMEGGLYSVSKNGYGSYEEVCKMNVFTYLDILLQQTIESIRQLKGAGLKPGEISEKMGLTVEQISTVL